MRSSFAFSISLIGSADSIQLFLLRSRKIYCSNENNLTFDLVASPIIAFRRVSLGFRFLLTPKPNLIFVCVCVCSIWKRGANKFAIALNFATENETVCFYETVWSGMENMKSQWNQRRVNRIQSFSASKTWCGIAEIILKLNANRYKCQQRKYFHLIWWNLSFLIILLLFNIRYSNMRLSVVTKYVEISYTKMMWITQ